MAAVFCKVEGSVVLYQIKSTVELSRTLSKKNAGSKTTISELIGNPILDNAGFDMITHLLGLFSDIVLSQPSIFHCK